jgi:hypothetical protein
MQAALEARRRERERAQEESLALELERQQREEESRRREIQRICAEDPGLRELQGKLQMAYIAKERGEQLKEREHVVVASKEHERALHEAMMRASAEAEAAQRVREEEEKKRSEERRRTLEAQLEEKQLKVFMESQQEAARERGMVEAILNKIAQEDAQELATKQKNREESIKVIAEFKAQRERAVEAARQAEREEQRRIADYLSNQGAREEAVKKAKAEDAAVRDSQYRAIVAEQEALRKKQEEEDALRWLLVEEEAERRRIEEEERRREKEARSKKEMVSANEHQKMCVQTLPPADEGKKKEERARRRARPPSSPQAARRGKSSGRPTHLLRSPPPPTPTPLPLPVPPLLPRRLREKIAAEERAKEQRLIEQFLAKCAEDNKKEEIGRRAREEARQRYLSEVNAQRESKTALFEAQKVEELRILEEAKRREEFRKRVIEEARRKLLEEHATKLVRVQPHCLPPQTPAPPSPEGRWLRVLPNSLSLSPAFLTPSPPPYSPRSPCSAASSPAA